jgi:hypothetical protein
VERRAGHCSGPALLTLSPRDGYGCGTIRTASVKSEQAIARKRMQRSLGAAFEEPVAAM